MKEARDTRTNAAARSPAEVYDERFVPAPFKHWGPALCDEANVRSGQRVLDVACGTGALKLAAAERVAPGGAVVGLDASPEMLAVARRKSAPIEWRDGRAEALPFPGASFDAVVSQFGFMFFEDKPTAFSELMRVVKPGGRLAVAVCDAVENSPGYNAFALMLDRLFGVEAGRACAWTLGGVLDDDQFERILEESETALRPFATDGGAIAFDMPSLFVKAQKA